MRSPTLIRGRERKAVGLPIPTAFQLCYDDLLTFWGGGALPLFTFPSFPATRWLSTFSSNRTFGSEFAPEPKVPP